MNRALWRAWKLSAIVPYSSRASSALCNSITIPTQQNPSPIHIQEEQEKFITSTDLIQKLHQCIGTKDLNSGKAAHALVIKTKLLWSLYINNNIMNMYSKCGKMDNARQLFDEMSMHNVVSWTTLISGYCKNSLHIEALNTFMQMRKCGAHPNTHTFSTVLIAASYIDSLEFGRQLHCLICKYTHLCLDAFIHSSLIDMYSKSKNFEDARQLFDRMCTRDKVTWNSMIVGYVYNGCYSEALGIFDSFYKNGIIPDEVTFSSVLRACSNLGVFKQGKEVHALVIKSGAKKMPSSGNAIIDMYAKCGSIGDSWKAFVKNNCRDTVTWNSIIVGCVKNRMYEEACRFFCEMRYDSADPDDFTFTSVISACAGLSALEQGRLVHCDAMKRGFEGFTSIGNSLLDMYSKSGSLDEAFHVFSSMGIGTRTIVTWTTMLTGCSQHGLAYEVIRLFNEMVEQKIKPDEISFVCLISSCSHAGLVEQGVGYFESMRDHGIEPWIEHYACMVDLLGRAGQLNEAEDFINSMPIEPTASVWGALLGACKIHINPEIAARAAEQLFRVEPWNSGNYVLLASIYAAAGRWTDVAMVRKMMDSNNVRKAPGCSWVEIKNSVHSFIVSDSSHPLKNEIYAKLDELVVEIRKLGYVPDTSTVITNDLNEQVKENNLLHHSERLALAFALISTPQGFPIRIKKNLRVCNDCHTAIKFISRITQREIFVRDNIRFHRFKEGVCSCGDYW